tara:strand:+ start:285 stop:497 length:213 start_codon:yes stop_codon:yes gene_type:complete
MFVGVDYPASAEGFEIAANIDAEQKKHRVISFDLHLGNCTAKHFRSVRCTPGNRHLHSNLFPVIDAALAN